MITLRKALLPPRRTGTSGDPEKGLAIPADSSARSIADGKDGGNPFVLGFDAIGTRWEIETHEPLGASLKRRIFERIEEFDAAYSRFRPDSLVSRIAAPPDGGRFDFPDDSVALFDLYDRLHEATGGAVDPLVGRDLERLGYDRTYSLAPASDPVRAEAHAGGRAPGRRTSSGTARRSSRGGPS